MTVEFFLKGLILGFAIAAPVGPIGVLCIRLLLSGGSALLRKCVSRSFMQIVNRASGVLIFVLGLYSLATLFT